MQQLIHERRDLCNILAKDIVFLVANINGYMTEIVSLKQTEKSMLEFVDSVIDSRCI